MCNPADDLKCHQAKSGLTLFLYPPAHRQFETSLSGAVAACSQTGGDIIHYMTDDTCFHNPSNCARKRETYSVSLEGHTCEIVCQSKYFSTRCLNSIDFSTAEIKRKLIAMCILSDVESNAQYMYW